MLIATWNVNSVRIRIEQVVRFLDELKPDLLCLQETKVEDAQFPSEVIKKKGYNVSYYGQKSYNGVALISHDKLEDVRLGFAGEVPEHPDIDELDQQKRIISCLLDGVRIVNVYVPNGSSVDSEKYGYKLKWLSCLNQYLESQAERNEPLCLLGDFNIALEDKDIHNPKRLSGGIMASVKERELLQKLISERLVDVFRIFEQGSDHWSWWDYRSGAWERDKGWRIDHIYLSNELINVAKSSTIFKEFRGNLKPSDHAPVLVDINWPSDEDIEDCDFYI